MSTTEDLLRLLHETTVPEEDGLFSVRPLPVGSHGWIGRSKQVGAAFLIYVREGDQPHPVSLRTIRARHRVLVEIDDGESRGEETVTLVECTCEDEETIKVFVRCVGAVLATQGGQLSSADVSLALDHLVELFREPSHATPAEIVGLWAELLVITECANPQTMASLWRLNASSRYDFGTNEERVDIKCTTSRLRHHEVSFDQANPPKGTTAGIVSVMTEATASGTTVRDLWERALQLAPESQHSIDTKCVRTLGRDWTSAQDYAYDLAIARSTVRLYNVQDIPRLTELPVGVLRARFSVDFSTATEWTGEAPSSDGPLALAMSCSEQN